MSGPDLDLNIRMTSSAGPRGIQIQSHAIPYLRGPPGGRYAALQVPAGQGWIPWIRSSVIKGTRLDIDSAATRNEPLDDDELYTIQ